MQSHTSLKSIVPSDLFLERSNHAQNLILNRCWMHTYLPISRGIPATKCARDDDDHLFVLQIASVVVLHAVKLCCKNTTKHIVDNVGVVTGTPCLCGIEDGGLDPALVVLAEDAGGVTHQPGQPRGRDSKKGRGEEEGREEGREEEENGGEEGEGRGGGGEGG